MFRLNFCLQYDRISKRVLEDNPADHPRVGEKHEHTLDKAEYEPCSDVDGAAYVDRPRGKIRQAAGRSGSKRKRQRDHGYRHALEEGDEAATTSQFAQAQVQSFQTAGGTRELRR